MASLADNIKSYKRPFSRSQIQISVQGAFSNKYVRPEKDFKGLQAPGGIPALKN